MHRFNIIALLAITVAAPAAAENLTQVATLLPPPVEAMQDTPASQRQMVDVPVLKQPVQKGETILSENITLQQIPATQAFASTITSAGELAGQQAVRPLMAGQPVNRLHVRVAPMVSRNQTVTFVYRKGGIELSGRAQALEDGQQGQSIRLMNTATRSTILGTVSAAGMVDVN